MLTVLVLAVSLLPLEAQQRGLVTSVSVPSDPVEAGAAVAITITGSNPCGAVHIDPGDGSQARTHPITQVPVTINHTYTQPGAYQIRAQGMGNCDGEAYTKIRIAPARPAEPHAQKEEDMRFREMDRDGDRVITRAEWTGSERSFRVHDWNVDGVLSGDEVRPGATRRGSFNRRDRNNDGVLSPRESADGPPESTRTITVDATRRWTDTGLSVRAGDAVWFEAEGTVQLSSNPADTADPAGSRSGRRAPDAPLRQHPAGALIARVGDSPPIFAGDRTSAVRAPRHGQLFLSVNDDHLPDNSGTFRVTVIVERRD